MEQVSFGFARNVMSITFGANDWAFDVGEQATLSSVDRVEMRD